MPRAKQKPEPASGTPRSTAAKEPSGEVLTLSEAAAYLQFSEADVLRLINEQALPARQLGNEWRFLKLAIQDWLASGTPTWETKKGAILELAGKYKDDPDLEQIVAEAYRRRGRSTDGGGSTKNVNG